MTKQTTSRPGDLLVRVGAIVFLVGAVGTIVTVAPLLLGTSRLPTPAYFVSMLMGVGLAVALGGLLRMAFAQRQTAEGTEPAAAGLPLEDSGGQAAAGL